ncbi:MAG: preprotein translocase subunit SecA [Planctomycetota bacterium]|nr:MAG: preprotein translocase subunit SecA [Planctomycetota bacterium]
MAIDFISTIDKILKFFIGDRNARELDKLQDTVDKINSLESTIQKMSDDDMKEQTIKFRERLDKGESLDDILPEAFALVREAGIRVLQMRHYDVQLIGGMVLHQGKIAEMKTGEGKTIVATLAIYLNALKGSAHLITVNEYLAERDAGKEGQIYEFLGLTVGIIKNAMSQEERDTAYQSDVTYGTNSEFGFDYLRDNMKTRKEHQVQHSLDFCVIDEVDSILIDEARTPLIISGPAEQHADTYKMIDTKVRQLKEGIHFNVSEKDHSVVMTEEGIEKIETLIGMGDLYSGKNMHLPHFIDNALRAHHLFKRDDEYMIAPDLETGEVSVLIVDENTGRTMPGRRWSDGLHQAIEAKEGIDIKEENQTLATITYQNFFKLYGKMSGMTGTALTEAKEFKQIYDLEVLEIPTNKPLIRMDMDDLIYGTTKEKYNAILEEIRFNHNLGRPILIGTIAIENSELLSNQLLKAGIQHDVLNAKQHAREADIIANAGALGAVTIATNMAGRGTDIVMKPFTVNELIAFWKEKDLAPKDLDPSLPKEKLDATIKKFWAEKLCDAKDGSSDQAQKDLLQLMNYHGVREARICETATGLGGLLIVGTERHDSRRIDNQLRGRSGRQGDPGGSQFYLSLEDSLMKIFAPEMVTNILRRMGLTDGEALDHPMVSRSIEKAQKKVEDRNFSIRKNLLEYDGVMSDQRQIIYRERQQILDDIDLKDAFQEKIQDTIDVFTSIHMSENISEEDRNYDEFIEQSKVKFNVEISKEEILKKSKQEAFGVLKQKIDQLYSEKEKKITEEGVRELERFLLLQVVDQKWKDHLHAMDYLKEGIHLRGQAQKDPKVEYKREGYELFTQMTGAIIDDVVSLVLHVEISQEEEEELLSQNEWEATAELHPDFDANGPASQKELINLEEIEIVPIKNEEPKIGRNDPCHCGSGKKYKKCHGKGLF